MDPTVARALQRAAAAFAVTFVLGSGVVFAIETTGDDGPRAGSSPSSTAGPGSDGGGVAASATPKAYLVWMPAGLPSTLGSELTTLPRVQRVAVATAGVGWLTRSTDEDGDPVDEPAPPFMVPLEVTGVTPRQFSAFIPRGAERDLVRGLRQDEAVLSSSAARLRRLETGATLEFDGVELEVAAVVPDALIGGYEVLVSRATAEDLDAGDPRYALLGMAKGATPAATQVRNDIVELLASGAREPPLEVRRPGSTTYLRAFDRSLPAVQLKRRFGEFTAHPEFGSTDLVFEERWFERNIDTRELPRLGSVTCHKKVLSLLKRAIDEVPVDAPLGDIGACWDPSWKPHGLQGILPPALWGASIRVSVSLNRPGNPPLLDQRIVETLEAWGFRWAGDDAYPDGSLFEFLHPPPREGGDAPSPAD